MAKFFRKKVLIPLMISLPVVATSIGVGVYFGKKTTMYDLPSLSIDSSTNEIKDILTNSNSDVPTDLKEYLLSIVNDIDKNKEIDVQKVAETLKKWAKINDYLSQIKQTNFSEHYTDFLQQSLNLNIAEIENKKNSLEKDIDKKDVSGVKQLIDKSDEIQQIENSLSNFYTTGDKFKEDYKQIQNVFTNLDTVLTKSSLQELKMNLVDNFTKHQDLKGFLNKIQKIQSNVEKIASKSNEDSEVEKNGKIDISDLGTIKSNDKDLNELKDSVADLHLTPTKQLDQIENNKNSAESQIDNLQSLSLELQTAFKDKISSTDDEKIITGLVNQASAYNTTASDLIHTVEMAKNVKQSSSYTSATNQNIFDSAFEKAQEVLNSNSKLISNNNYLDSDSSISTLGTLTTNLKAAIAALNGKTNEKEIVDFKADVEKKLEVGFYKGVDKYNLKNLIYSVSIDNDTKPLLLTENTIDDVELTYLGSQLNNDDINKLDLTYQATKISDPKVTATIHKTMTFTNDFKTIINKIHFGNLDDLFDFDYGRLANYFESDVQSKKTEIESKFTNKLTNVNGFFTYKIKEGSLAYEADKTISLSVDFFVNKRLVKEEKLKTKQPITFWNNGSTGDQRFGFDYDLKKAVSFIEHKHMDNNKPVPNLDAELIWENTTIKPGATKTHSDYKPDDAIKALDESYDFPKIGEYQIYPKKIIWPKYTNDKDYMTTANVFFWIKKDGVDLPFSEIKSNISDSEEYENNFAKNINYFKPFYFTDIQPKNGHEWFESSDFVPEDKTKHSIFSTDKAIIDQINSKNFEIRKADGAIINKQPIKYSVLDPQDIIQQKAYSALNYLLKLKSTNGANQANNSTNTTSKEEQEAKQAAKNNMENNEFKDNKEVEDGLKDALGKIIKPKNTPPAAKDSDFYSSKDDISSSEDRANNLNISSISQKYFIYFYDVKAVTDHPDYLSFKLGFIFKNDTRRRYSPNKTFILTHLRNDFKYNLYPEVILNRLKLSDFRFDNSNNLTSSTSLEQIQSQIHWNESKITYNHFDFLTNHIKVAEVVAKNGGIYVKFKYTDPTTQKTTIGNNYYKISNFTVSNSAFKTDFNFTNPNLKTVFESANSVERTRKIEFYFKDQSWNYNDKDGSANWTLKKKYLDKTFFQNNPSKRKIKLTILGDTLVQDDFRLSRFIDRSQIHGNYSSPYTVTIDFEKLMSEKTETVSFKTYQYSIDGHRHAPELQLNLTATLLDNHDINFKLSLADPTYKLVVGNPYFYMLSPSEVFGSRFGEFKNDQAFLLNYYGASVEISYTNAEQHEEFTTEDTQTNQFNYKELDFSQENQPITFYNPESTLNSDEYNPNQNVNYELHNGYLMDQEYIHSGWKNNELVKQARAREFAFSFGTGTELAKVSNDPKDLTFYGISNRHIVKVNSWKDLRTPAGYQGRSYFTKPSDKFQNDVNTGYSYWGGGQVGRNMKLQVIWTGIEQTNKNGVPTGSGKENIDATVFSFNVKPMIDDARKWGRMELVKWFEDLAKLPDVKFNTSWKKQGISLNPDVRRYAIIGFPYGKQAGYYINRVKNAQDTISLAHANNYVQTFYNAGNSGTGILGSGDEYVATINSGVPLTGLQGWKYDTPNFNYFGINFDGEHPLDLKNTNSLAAEIIRRHLEKPLDYKLPWFFHNFKGYTKQNK
ncbi:MGA_1079 family surface serine endopeptidase [Mesomycoplasma bovoculi]|uniref:Uncharacterized protein n=1 Tax=Mesomycoplasma bovoculi M165/69 TaxID=743966 RepID=W5UT07_9BACT|nr:hypothetical protein [Mesomycoplasma bovoculi]AHH45272.1 hypothetical protein MYB_01310 [Mesomycoplasma bovoculi M165/69]